MYLLCQQEASPWNESPVVLVYTSVTLQSARMDAASGTKEEAPAKEHPLLEGQFHLTIAVSKTRHLRSFKPEQEDEEELPTGKGKVQCTRLSARHVTVDHVVHTAQRHCAVAHTSAVAHTG